MRRVAGARWRVLAHRWEPITRMYDRDFEAGSLVVPDPDLRYTVQVPTPGMEIDEIVIDRWLHLEQMNDHDWWLNVGGVVVNVRVDREGRPRAVLVELERQDGVEYRGEVG